MADVLIASEPEGAKKSVLLEIIINGMHQSFQSDARAEDGQGNRIIEADIIPRNIDSAKLAIQELFKVLRSNPDTFGNVFDVIRVHGLKVDQSTMQCQGYQFRIPLEYEEVIKAAMKDLSQSFAQQNGRKNKHGLTPV